MKGTKIEGRVTEKKLDAWIEVNRPDLVAAELEAIDISDQN